MEDESEKSLGNLDDVEEFSGIEDRHNILSLMRNMVENENRRTGSVEIFDDNNHDVCPTFWGKEGQLATCKKCKKTGETITRKKCGVGNSCCSCCFFILCMWCFIPCLCCTACDIHHFCSFCGHAAGVKTFI